MCCEEIFPWHWAGGQTDHEKSREQRTGHRNWSRISAAASEFIDHDYWRRTSRGGQKMKMPPSIGKCRQWVSAGHWFPSHRRLLPVTETSSSRSPPQLQLRNVPREWANRSTMQWFLDSRARVREGRGLLWRMLLFASCRSNSYNLSRMGGAVLLECLCASVHLSGLPLPGPLNWNRKFINKLCLLLINQSEVQHCRAAAGSCWILHLGLPSAAGSPNSLCSPRQSWRVAHVGWQGISAVRTLWSTLVVNLHCKYYGIPKRAPSPVSLRQNYCHLMRSKLKSLRKYWMTQWVDANHKTAIITTWKELHFTTFPLKCRNDKNATSKYLHSSTKARSTRASLYGLLDATSRQIEQKPLL